MTTLARGLQSRGHDVTFIAFPFAVAAIRAAGLPCIPYCEKELPIERVAALHKGLSQLEGEEAVEFSFIALAELLRAALDQLPAAIAAAGIDALVMDVTHYFLGLVPMHLGIPYVHVAPGLPLDLSGATPPRFFGWPFETTPAALERNRAGVRRIRELMKPCTDAAKKFSKKMGMSVDWSEPDPTISKLAWITQMPQEFDFPSDHWPPQFRYTGPIHGEVGRAEAPFPWERLTGEPLIYASMGTLQNGQTEVFQTIVEAAERLSGFQLALAIGNNLGVDQIKTSLSKTIVVNHAPQLKLLKRAALCVTHAGMNTALEALTQGVPMVAIPVTNDQPAVAARIVHHHVGESLPIKELTPTLLHAAMSEVVGDASYQRQSQYFKEAIARVNGLDEAAKVIERAFGL